MTTYEEYEKKFEEIMKMVEFSKAKFGFVLRIYIRDLQQLKAEIESEQKYLLNIIKPHSRIAKSTYAIYSQTIYTFALFFIQEFIRKKKKKQ